MLPVILAALLVAVILVLATTLVRLEVRRKGQQRLASAEAIPVPPTGVADNAPAAPPRIPTSPPAGAYLQYATDATRALQYYSLNAAVVTIGRDPGCTIQIPESLTAVSRRHAKIEHDGHDYILSDLDSENGVFVDGVRVGRNLLRDGVEISLAQAVFFVFHAERRSQP